jgi:hypothetical protein
MTEAAIECAKNHAIGNIEEILNCSNGTLGDYLLYSNGIVTDGLVPRKNYVPWIIKGNVYSKTEHKEAENDLTTFICKSFSVT